MRLASLCAAAALLGLAGCDRPGAAPDNGAQQAPSTDAAASSVSVDPSGAAPPQPAPTGGDTPVGAAGPEGASPTSREAAGQPPH
jgi:hypothetical protein